MKSKALLALILSGGVIMAACNADKDAAPANSDKTQPETVDLQTEMEAYQAFAMEQMDHFLIETEKFVIAVKNGDIDKAKEIYPKARMYFERSEPIAESFGDLDPRIDARLADLEEEGQGKEDWSGYHKIEYGLWIENTTVGYEETADQLLKDAKELRARVETVEVTPDLMITGAVDLLNEVSTSKITGEEEIYSHTDLYDFKANIEGAEKIVEILKEKIELKDAKLVDTLTAKFTDLNNLLAKHEDGSGNYISYEQLTKEDTKALAEAVNQLGEPLSQIGIIME
ncbi:EfeM/EfeO family lipoprotein [Sporosarcina sp. E16_3]|uniref:iron uptake system protein EfeO n=1 Tax=Sporosarcina sp. E16_3 TaxID=2789293 RepID=UPI001A928D69|nr:iron uptake system protein EfeO [Sporosarcina sp. E16_3]MBO0602366.1 EfeM/EfeO family lipoprotein [Sporosarcina sp. E16_3]